MYCVPWRVERSPDASNQLPLGNSLHVAFDHLDSLVGLLVYSLDATALLFSQELYRTVFKRTALHLQRTQPIVRSISSMECILYWRSRDRSTVSRSVEPVDGIPCASSEHRAQLSLSCTDRFSLPRHLLHCPIASHSLPMRMIHSIDLCPYHRRLQTPYSPESRTRHFLLQLGSCRVLLFDLLGMSCRDLDPSICSCFAACDLQDIGRVPSWTRVVALQSYCHRYRCHPRCT